MRSKILLSFLRRGFGVVCLICLISSAQGQTFVTVGTASSTSSSGGPTTSTTANARTERHTAVYSIAELNTAGLSANATLLGIGWNKTGDGNYAGTNLSIKVWLKHNNATTFSANPSFNTETGAATLVYQSTNSSIPEAIGPFFLAFNTNSFVWNGTENIQVITEIVRSASWTSSSFSWTTLASLTNAAANSNGASAVDAMTRTGTRPQVRFEVADAGTDGALIEIPNPVSGTPGTQNIEAVLRNTGSTIITNASISWKINGGAITNAPWSGSLNPGETALVSLGASSFSLGTQVIEATLVNVNTTPDNNSANNIKSKSILICNILSGSYSINKTLPTSGTNFNSFNDLSTALSSCGVNGNVIVNVADNSGPYNEQVVFQNIPGIGVSSSVVINGNGETITSDTAIIQTGSNPNRHIIRLIGLQYFTINDLRIDMFTGSTGFIGVHVLSSGNHITISNCVVDMGAATSTLLGGFVFNNDPASVISAGGNFDNIIVTGNSVTGGGYGISVFGLASPLASNVVISNNTFNNFSSNGIYLRETSGAAVNNNNFNKTAGTSSNAIQVAQTANVNARIFNNRITMSQSNGALVGIYLFGGSGHKVYNNVIYDIQSVSGTVSGIQLRTASSGYEVYNNTISFDHTAATTGNLYGIRIETNNTGAIIRNNMISITQAAAFKSGLMMSSNSGINASFSSDYNVFWVPGGYVAGYMNVSTPTLYATTLADWKTLTSHDVNSWEQDPGFESLTLPRPTNAALNDKGVSYGGLTTDILDVTRNSPPDIGAYEFTPPMPVTLLNFRGEQSGSINKLFWSTSTETNNRGFELERSADGRNFSSVIFVASKAENGNSTSTLNYSYNDARPNAGDNYYRLKQVDKDGKYSYSNVVLLSRKVSDITLSGVYPNPTDRELNLVITSPRSEKVMIVVTDLTGKVVMQRSTQLVTGDNQETLNVQRLSAGTYIIKAVCANGCETAVHRFVKQ